MYVNLSYYLVVQFIYLFFDMYLGSVKNKNKETKNKINVLLIVNITLL